MQMGVKGRPARGGECWSACIDRASTDPRVGGPFAASTTLLAGQTSVQLNRVSDRGGSYMLLVHPNSAVCPPPLQPALHMLLHDGAGGVA
jgi:hypothetical protein